TTHCKLYIRSVLGSWHIIDDRDPYVFACAFFSNATDPPEISTLSLHDALPIFPRRSSGSAFRPGGRTRPRTLELSSSSSRGDRGDRKSTRLNSSHVAISYAVFCLKKKNKAYLSHYASLVLNMNAARALFTPDAI